MKTIRLYGRSMQRWESWNGRRHVVTQVELPYKEYDLQGNIVATGTEDFSADRLRSLTWAEVKTWDGRKRNAGGHRWWSHEDTWRIASSNKSICKQLIRSLYPNALDVNAIYF